MGSGLPGQVDLYFYWISVPTNFAIGDEGFVWPLGIQDYCWLGILAQWKKILSVPRYHWTIDLMHNHSKQLLLELEVQVRTLAWLYSVLLRFPKTCVFERYNVPTLLRKSVSGDVFFLHVEFLKSINSLQNFNCLIISFIFVIMLITGSCKNLLLKILVAKNITQQVLFSFWQIKARQLTWKKAIKVLIFCL